MNRFPPNDIIGLVSQAPRYDLAESVGPDLALSELLSQQAWPSLSLGYGSAAGSPALREAIAARYSGVKADEVVVTAGGMHALFLLAFTMCGEGSEAIAASPLFPLARNALQAVGARVASWPLSFDRGYQPDVASLRALLSPATHVVSLASPQNPSGVAIEPRLLREVVSCVEEHAPDAWLVMDETYREAAYGEDAAATSALALGPRVLSVASLSKCHGAPGLRIGWVVVRDAALREQLVRAKFNTIISCSPLDEALALEVLRQGDRILGVRRERLAQNLEQVAQWVQHHGQLVEWVRPDAGALCCVRLRASSFNDEAVEHFHAALPRHEIRVAPGPWFGEEARVFRLGFGVLGAPALREALRGMSRALGEAL